MRLGFVMQADAAPHDDRRFWPDVVDHHRGRRPLLAEYERRPQLIHNSRVRKHLDGCKLGESREHKGL
jgi:hypothetical protein